ncbi:MAG: hypothetical protein WAL65_17980 [Candidatus Sulfotelmatobacter sp.]
MPFPQCAVPLLDEGGIFAHLCDRHTSAAQAIDKIEPTEVKFVVDAPPAVIANHAGYQSLGFIPANGMNAPARPRRKCADVKALGDRCLGPDRR